MVVNADVACARIDAKQRNTRTIVDLQICATVVGYRSDRAAHLAAR